MAAKDLHNIKDATGTVFESGVTIKPYSMGNSGTSTLTPNAALSNIFHIDATGDFTLDGPSNGVDGQRIVVRIKQDGTGSRILTLGTGIALGADIIAVTLSTGIDVTDYLGLIFNSLSNAWHVISFIKGFAV